MTLALHPTTRPSPYLTTVEAAIYLRFPSPKALLQAVYDGTIPAWCVSRRGRRRLFDSRVLDQWLHEETMRPARGRAVVNPDDARRRPACSV